MTVGSRKSRKRHKARTSRGAARAGGQHRSVFRSGAPPPPARPPEQPSWLIHFGVIACFFLSGLAALLYQTAWLRQFSLVFGTSELVVVTVLDAYMGGLALAVALLYAINTAGAVCGTVIAAFMLLPALRLNRTVTAFPKLPSKSGGCRPPSTCRNG